MSRAAVSLLVLASAVTARPHRPPSQESQLKRSCTRCHRVDVVHAQHLSKHEWDLELDKMTAMGAKIADREALLDYLVKKYGPPAADAGEKSR